MLRSLLTAGTHVSKAAGRAGAVVCARGYAAAANRKHIVIAGGGTGGLSVAASLASDGHEVTVVEPSPYHYYQPLWTLVGGGVSKAEESRKPTEEVIPANVYRVNDRVKNIVPSENRVDLEECPPLFYDALVVATGIVPNLEAVKGLKESLKEDKRVCTIYQYDEAPKVWEAAQSTSSGNALFTFPAGPLKCAGAPQKIMYLCEEHWCERGVRDSIDVQYFTTLPAIFGVKKYAERLMQVCAKRNIGVNLQHTLTEIDSDASTAKFNGPDGNVVERKFDFLHVGLPHKAVPAIAQSDVSDDSGFVDVDEGTLQHKRFPNVFALGDCSTLPTSKTAAAVTSQSKAVKASVREFLAGKPLTSAYNGYTSCPLVTGKGKLILAEFKYGAEPHETFFWDQGNENQLQYLMKKEIMPQLYWKMLLKGQWEGPGTARKFFNPLDSN